MDEKNVYANHSNVVVKLIDNKFRKTKTDSGIILPGNAYKSEETGQIEQDLELLIALAVVVNAGPECRYVKDNDEVYVDTRSIRPVPFKGLHYGVTNEQNILVIVK